MFCTRALIVLALLMAGEAAVAAAEQSAAERLQALKEEKVEILNKLIEPVVRCVRREDTDHPAFHGCIDWHSAVHGTWALVKYTQLTGDRSHLPLIRSTLTPENIRAESDYLKSHPSFEMPYGRAWFLRLASDYRWLFHSEELDEMADEVAESMVHYYRQHPPDPWLREYRNSSWALINLYDYAVSSHREKLRLFVLDNIHDHFLNPGRPCPIGDEARLWPDFMPICTTWAYLVVRSGELKDPQSWLNRYFPDSSELSVIRQPSNAHHMAMNFSRAWGLWHLWKATGNPQYLNLYLDHFRWQLKQRAWWSGDYHSVGHWVAQFGVLAYSFALEE